MKNRKLIVSILAGLTFMFTSILPAQAFVFYPFEPIPFIPLLLNPVYVDCVSGDDAHAGTKAAPFKTILKATSVASGATQVLIAQGECSVPLTISVNANDVSYFGGYYNNFDSRDPENHLTQVKGGVNTVFDINNRSSTIDGLKITSQTNGTAAINIDTALAADVSITITGVEIDSITAGSGISAKLESGDNLKINNNYLHNISSFASTIFVTGSGDTKIYNNFLYGNSGGLLGAISAENSLITNNIISKTQYNAGIKLATGTKAYNNTVVNGVTGLHMNLGVTGVTFKNNIVAYNSGKGLDLGDTATYTNNGYFSNGVAHTLGTGEVSCDPKLNNVNSTNPNDYKLGSASDCIDKGVELSEVTKDYFGSARKKDGNADAVFATDIGAHEADGDTAAAPSITGNTANPNTFSPNADGVNDTTTISYTTNVIANVIVAIYDGSTVIKQLTNAVQASGVHNVNWDGKDTGGTVVNNKTYTYKITAQNSINTADKSGDVTVDIGSVTPPSTLCAGFTDVSFDDPLCPAITWVKNEGIFQGYGDGSFQPYKIIQRDETTKVVLVGFDIPLLADDHTNLGFSDLTIGQWYIPYIRTGKVEHILQGYDDGTFRPGAQVQKDEMLKIFLEASGEDLSGATSTNPPYPDVPLNVWFTIYIQFSKNHALVEAASDGKFYPAQGMKRGDVAKLFYRFHEEGFI